MRFVALVVALATPGCATILSRSDWPVTFASEPSGRRFSVRDRDGVERVAGVTPLTVTLPSGYAPWRAAWYDVESDGVTRRIEAGPNMWGMANGLLGPVGIVLGGLITDPLTGAAWRLPEVVRVDQPAVQ